MFFEVLLSLIACSSLASCFIIANTFNGKPKSVYKIIILAFFRNILMIHAGADNFLFLTEITGCQMTVIDEDTKTNRSRFIGEKCKKNTARWRM